MSARTAVRSCAPSGPAPSAPDQESGDRRGWTPGRVIAFAAGILLSLLSLSLLAGSVYAVCADLGHWTDDSVAMSWLSGALLGSAGFVALPAVALILIPPRLARSGEGARGNHETSHRD